MSASRRSIPAPFAALVLALILWGPEARGIGIISVDEGEPGYSREGGRKRGKKEAPSGGDIQVGPAVNEGKRRRNRMPAAEPVADDSAAPSAEATETAEVPPPKGLIGSRVPGIFPVYEADKRWMLVERVPAGGKRIVKQDTQLVVIGSKGAAQFHAATSTQSYLPACRDAKPAKTLAFLLSAKSPKNFQQVGTPIIAIAMKPGASFDSSRAVFYALRNEVKEEVYQKLSGPIVDSVVEDLKSGTFQIKLGDSLGHAYAQSPDPKKIQMKIDFGSKLRLRGFEDAFVLIEGVQLSKSFRRCLRLFEAGRPVGSCVEMPHELMSETRSLQFVAYDPSGKGTPFILAYTQDPPLWGHERWGFQVTTKGPKLFLKDTLDPRCRESF